MIANAASRYKPTDTVFDVTTDADHLTHGMFVCGTTVIDWGDGTKSTTNSVATAPLYSATAVSHTYSAPGTYTVIVSGTGYRISHSNNSYFPEGATRRLTRIRQIGNNLYAINAMFQSCPITTIDEGCTFGSVTSTSADSCFYSAGSFDLPESFAFPSNTTSMSTCFYSCSIRSADHLHIPSSVTNLENFFGFAGNLVSLSADFKIPSGCTNVKNLFNFATHLKHDISNMFPEEWATGTRNINIQSMFNRTDAKLTGTAPANLLWESSNNFTYNTSTFAGCTQLTNYSDIPSSWGGGGA